MTPRTFTFREACGCWLAVQQRQSKAEAEGCSDGKAMHTDILGKALWGIMRWSKGARLWKHTFTQTEAALGLTVVSTLHTSSGCTKGWIGHITHFVLPTVFQKIVFCSTKIQNSVLFSSESSKRRVHTFVHPKVSQQVRLETIILMPYRFFFSWAVWNYDTEQQDGHRCQKPTLPFCLFRDNHILKPGDPEKYIHLQDSKIYSFRWYKHRNTYKCTYTHFCFKANYANKKRKDVG